MDVCQEYKCSFTEHDEFGGKDNEETGGIKGLKRAKFNPTSAKAGVDVRQRLSPCTSCSGKMASGSPVA